jgi:hypothetical protein
MHAHGDVCVHTRDWHARTHAVGRVSPHTQAEACGCRSHASLSRTYPTYPILSYVGSYAPPWRAHPRPSGLRAPRGAASRPEEERWREGQRVGGVHQRVCGAPSGNGSEGRAEGGPSEQYVRCHQNRQSVVGGTRGRGAQRESGSAARLTAVACPVLYLASSCFCEAMTCGSVGGSGGVSRIVWWCASPMGPAGRYERAMSSPHLRRRLPHLDQVVLHLDHHRVQQLLGILRLVHCMGRCA